MAAPTLVEVADQLRALLAGRITRDQASAWARHWLIADERDVDDDVVWRALERLGAAQLPGSERDFLYYDADFHAWLDEVESSIEARA